ncbi:MAG: response regulator [Caldilineaceae bacterium]
MRAPIHILAVEDDAVDAELLLRHFQSRSTQYTLTVEPNSLAALHYLRAQAARSLPAFPHLILLDLNLPGVNGLTFLRTLRQDPILRRLIVFILTTSNLDSDKAAAYQTGIAGYILKKNITTFLQWLDTYCALVKFPPAA